MQPALPFELPTLGPEPRPAASPDYSSMLAGPHPRSHSLAPSRSLGPQALHSEPVFVRHPRARRYIIRVADNGVVRVTVPRWGSKREAHAFAVREHRWIEKERERIEEQRTRRKVAEIPADVEQALRERARCELPSRLLDLAAEHGIAVSRVSVRNQRWRWGSCSRRGHICLNWRLVQMPQSVGDYVMIHELMHVKRMDHSPKFWQLVAAACPGYIEARQWLVHRAAVPVGA